MVSTPAPFGLLLDVDGPIASPITRTIAIPSIVSDLIELADAGIPLVFNTGRSDSFIRQEVIAPLMAVGIPEHARIFAICEKGAVWFPITPTGAGDPVIDETLTVPADYARSIQQLVDERFDDTMFYDHTKRAMVSVEQHTSVESADYLAAQVDFDTLALAEFRSRDLGAIWRDVEAPDEKGAIEYRIDPTIISTDIESVRVGKDLGAERAVELLTPGGELPRIWRTVGDSRTDYAMADWLHEHGYDVSHVDVRPADGIPDKPYPVLTAGDAIHDEAGALYLQRWVAMVRGEASDDAGVLPA